MVEQELKRARLDELVVLLEVRDEVFP